MPKALLLNNTVIDIVADDVDTSIFAKEIEVISCDASVVIGALFDGKKFSSPSIEKPNITKILVPLTARQFWQAALVIGVTEEGLAADVSNPDSPLYVEDEEERESVLIDIKKTTQFNRNHYLIEKLTTAKNIPTEQLDSLWQWASHIE